MHKIVKIALCLALFFSFGCRRRGSDHYTESSYDSGFDTIFSYTEYGSSKETTQANFEIGDYAFKRYNDLFDIYNDVEGVNNIKMINDNAGEHPVYVDDEIIDLLLIARDVYELTNGQFDITMGNLLHVWEEYREKGMEANAQGKQGEVPTEEELTEAKKYSGFDKIIINEDEKSVFITEAGVSIDVGGIAKGYAVEQIAKKIDPEIMHYSVIDAGRNIRTINDKDDGEPWVVGIQHPTGEGSIVSVQMNGSMSFVTSGDYERTYEADDGKFYHHIIDPTTLYPADYYRSVTIITPDSAYADALSTALFTMSIEDGMEVLKRYRDLTGRTAEAIWIMDPEKNTGGKVLDNLRVIYTENLEDKLIWD